MTGSTYDRLSAHFPTEKHKQRSQAGQELTYLPAEAVISRLNEVLGFTNWSFRVVREGYTGEEAWVLGRIEAHVDGGELVREQYGTMATKRGQYDSTDVMKGAATDALKKCASLIGVGLYLFDDEERGQVVAEIREQRRQGGRQGGPPQQQGQRAPSPDGGGGQTCEECGEALPETRFKDGTAWTPEQLAGYGRRKHSRVLCMTHYREANDAKRRAEEALQQVPF
jgi:hypothetical protein